MIVKSGFVPALTDAVKEAWEKWIGEIKKQLDPHRNNEPIPQPVYLRR